MSFILNFNIKFRNYVSIHCNYIKDVESPKDIDKGPIWFSELGLHGLGNENGNVLAY